MAESLMPSAYHAVTPLV